MKINLNVMATSHLQKYYQCTSKIEDWQVYQRKEETLFSQLALTSAGFDQNGLEHICKMEGIQEKLKHTEVSVHLQKHKSDVLPKGKCRSHVLFDELF